MMSSLSIVSLLAQLDNVPEKFRKEWSFAHIFRKNFDYILKHISDLNRVATLCYSAGFLSNDEKESIIKETKDLEKANTLLGNVSKKVHCDFKKITKFIEILNETENDHLFPKLEQTLQNFIQEPSVKSMLERAPGAPNVVTGTSEASENIVLIETSPRSSFLHVTPAEEACLLIPTTSSAQSGSGSCVHDSGPAVQEKNTQNRYPTLGAPRRQGSASNGYAFRRKKFRMCSWFAGIAAAIHLAALLLAAILLIISWIKLSQSEEGREAATTATTAGEVTDITMLESDGVGHRSYITAFNYSRILTTLVPASSKFTGTPFQVTTRDPASQKTTVTSTAPPTLVPTAVNDNAQGGRPLTMTDKLTSSGRNSDRTTTEISTKTTIISTAIQDGSTELDNTNNPTEPGINKNTGTETTPESYTVSPSGVVASPSSTGSLSTATSPREPTASTTTPVPKHCSIRVHLWPYLDNGDRIPELCLSSVAITLTKNDSTHLKDQIKPLSMVARLELGGDVPPQSLILFMDHTTSYLHTLHLNLSRNHCSKTYNMASLKFPTTTVHHLRVLLQANSNVCKDYINLLSFIFPNQTSIALQNLGYTFENENSIHQLLGNSNETLRSFTCESCLASMRTKILPQVPFNRLIRLRLYFLNPDPRILIAAIKDVAKVTPNLLYFHTNVPLTAKEKQELKKFWPKLKTMDN